MEEKLYLFVYTIKTKTDLGKYTFERKFPLKDTKVFTSTCNKTIIITNEETYKYCSSKTMLTFEPLPMGEL